MFELSFYTILMAFLTSTVLFSLSCIFFSSSKRILNVGYKTIAFISFLSILRLVVPIDFDFTAILPMNELAKQISFFICQHRIAFFLGNQALINIDNPMASGREKADLRRALLPGNGEGGFVAVMPGILHPHHRRHDNIQPAQPGQRILHPRPLHFQ